MAPPHFSTNALPQRHIFGSTSVAHQVVIDRGLLGRPCSAPNDKLVLYTLRQNTFQGLQDIPFVTMLPVGATGYNKTMSLGQYNLSSFESHDSQPF